MVRAEIRGVATRCQSLRFRSYFLVYPSRNTPNDTYRLYSPVVGRRGWAFSLADLRRVRTAPIAASDPAAPRALEL